MDIFNFNIDYSNFRNTEYQTFIDIFDINEEFKKMCIDDKF